MLPDMSPPACQMPPDASRTPSLPNAPTSPTNYCWTLGPTLLHNPPHPSTTLCNSPQSCTSLHNPLQLATIFQNPPQPFTTVCHYPQPAGPRSGANRTPPCTFHLNIQRQRWAQCSTSRRRSTLEVVLVVGTLQRTCMFGASGG